MHEADEPKTEERPPTVSSRTKNVKDIIGNINKTALSGTKKTLTKKTSDADRPRGMKTTPVGNTHEKEEFLETLTKVSGDISKNQPSKKSSKRKHTPSAIDAASNSSKLEKWKLRSQDKAPTVRKEAVDNILNQDVTLSLTTKGKSTVTTTDNSPQFRVPLSKKAKLSLKSGIPFSVCTLSILIRKSIIDSQGFQSHVCLL